MQNDWPTKEQDLAFAQKTIDKYLDYNEDSGLGLFEFIMKNASPLSMQLSDWVVEISEHFESLYGEDAGQKITERIITKCLLQGETVH